MSIRARGTQLAAGAVVACALVLALGSGDAARADSSPTPGPTQSTTYDTVPEEFALTISPTRLALGPADVGDLQTISVVNRGEGALHVDVQKQNFSGAIDGSLGLRDDAPYSAANWLTVEPSSFDLEPGAALDVSISIIVPKSPDLGDHQVALVFLVPAGESLSNIKVNRGIAVPVYITVPGTVDDTVVVTDFQAPPFSSGGPITITALVQNAGTVHRDFRGNSALAIDGTATNFPDFTVVRGSDREISATWDPPLFCVCQLSVSIVNADGVSRSSTVQVIVFPVGVASVILALLVIGVVTLVVIRRQHRKSVARITAGRHASGGDGDG
jgi:hypothetical protein